MFAGAFVLAEAVGAAAAGDGLTELFGLKKSASVFFAGEGDGVTDAAAAAVFFLRPCFSAGEADGAAAAAGAALLVAAGEAVVAASAFLWDLCLAGEGEAEAAGVGDWALTRLAAAKPTDSRKTVSFMFMRQSLTMAAGEGKGKEWDRSGN